MNNNLEKYKETVENSGLLLTEEEIKSLIISNETALKSYGRLEFGESILNRLFTAFSDSPYIDARNQCETFDSLLILFYDLKNEYETSDEELIEDIKETFNGKAGGDIDFCRDLLYGYQRFTD